MEKANSSVPKPRKTSVLSNYEISVSIAFKRDCEVFLVEFAKQKTLSYAKFANIWQLKNMSYIFADQTYVSLLKTLCEECFAILTQCIIHQKNVYMKIGALYLLYGLYYKQPIEGMVKIRVSYDEYTIIKDLMDEMAKEKYMEPLFIFAKLKADVAFNYVGCSMPRSIRFIKNTKKAFTAHTLNANFGENPLSKFEGILQDESVVKLQDTCKRYEMALKKNSSIYPNIDQFKSTIMDDLNAAHKKLFSEDHSTPSEQIETDLKILNSRQEIKLRALKSENATYRGAKQVLTAIDLE
ncbi:snRNA-activating protein complex subunit 1-like [Sitophilus oryzae]|uniref:snRNA-activating protein complex subunit 1-like n=1 Tax=Sitophilus oryzae TaxID=7048 RepID=A0A6J2X8P8_SITOR|nr:snRNA-activating protein complex subunit 1-like [Sitophilus oryzae]